MFFENIPLSDLGYYAIPGAVWLFVIVKVIYGLITATPEEKKMWEENEKKSRERKRAKRIEKRLRDEEFLRDWYSAGEG